MARVICKLPNAGTLINGVRFTEDRGEMISDEIPEEVALDFAAIPGYTLVGIKPAEEPPATTEPPGSNAATDKPPAAPEPPPPPPPPPAATDKPASTGKKTA